jgi:TRAP-type C4-dicarboxylate transport system permease small subunit
MRRILVFLHKRAEDVLVLLTGVMFAAFIIQIFTRYVLNAPTDWTHELILICWLWIVFWGAAFFLEDKDHVKFDVLYNLGSGKARRVMSLIVALVMAGAFLASLPATWDFISFKRIRSTDVLHIRFDLVFSVYLIFLVAGVAHYVLRAFRLLRGHSLAELDREESL